MPLGGTMSIDNQLKAGLAELDCSAAIFIAIAGISSTSKLSQAFSGIRALDTDEALALKKVLDEMKALHADIAAYVGHPVSIAWKPNIREVLEDRRTKKNNVRSPFSLPGPAVQPRPVSQEEISKIADQLHPAR